MDKENGAGEGQTAPPKDPPASIATLLPGLDEETKAVIIGRTPPPNPHAAYVVSRLREIGAKGHAVNQRLTQARNIIAELEQEALRLQGQGEAYLRDLNHWLKWEEEEPKESETSGEPDMSEKVELAAS